MPPAVKPTPNLMQAIRAAALGLPGRLLALTVLFVMLSEVFIFLPSIANYRMSWLKDRVRAASIAAIAAKAAPDGALPDMLKKELLMTAGLRAIALKSAMQRRLILDEAMPPAIDATYDLRTIGFVGGIVDALAVFAQHEDRVLLVVDRMNAGIGGPLLARLSTEDDTLEIVVNEAQLRADMVRWGLSILGLSILISLFTAGLVYLALYGLLVRPLRRLTAHMMRFARAPEAPDAVLVPSRRSDEIGTVERELAHMQSDLRSLLKERGRLAALGLAVSKINHDLRNILANAQLISDRLACVEDPGVQRMTPKLIASLDRAIRLCTETLQYGRSTEPEPAKRTLQLRPLLVDVGESLDLPRTGASPTGSAAAIDWRLEVSDSLGVCADPDQLHRILGNLVRNAMQVLENAPAPADPGELGHCITVRAHQSAAAVIIDVTDTGPGVPAKARARLFQPFQGARPGGTGLGLAIVAELMRAHGGSVELVEATPAPAAGTTFRLTFPDDSRKNPSANGNAG